MPPSTEPLQFELFETGRRLQHTAPDYAARVSADDSAFGAAIPAIDTELSSESTHRSAQQRFRRPSQVQDPPAPEHAFVVSCNLPDFLPILTGEAAFVIRALGPNFYKLFGDN